MTDIEAKALALVNAHPGCETWKTMPGGSMLVPFEVLCRAIEREAATEARHAAEMRELKGRFSEALKRYYGVNGCPPHPILAPFILPAPDPLDAEDPIDALVDLLAPVLTHSQGMAARERENRFRNALAALKVRGV